MPAAHPDHASVVVVGGGVIGLSAAYHLAQVRGPRRGAGREGRARVRLDQQGRGRGPRTVLRRGEHRARASAACGPSRRSRDDFGQEIDLHQVGYLFLLDRPEHVAAFERNVALQNELGVPSRMIEVGRGEAAVTARLHGRAPGRGLLARPTATAPLSPSCSGTPRRPRAAGATILRRCVGRQASTVTAGRITAVLTDRGPIRTEVVVCAAGAWSRAVGEMAGVDLPVTPQRRQILVTEPVPGLDPRTPFTIDFATSFYFHARGPGAPAGHVRPGPEPRLRPVDDAWLPGWRGDRATVPASRRGRSGGPASTRTRPTTTH